MPKSAVSATGSADLCIGATVCRTSRPEETGTVVALPQPPLAQVEWGDYAQLHWIDTLTVLQAPRKRSLRDRLRHPLPGE